MKKAAYISLAALVLSTGLTSNSVYFAEENTDSNEVLVDGSDSSTEVVETSTSEESIEESTEVSTEATSSSKEQTKTETGDISQIVGTWHSENGELEEQDVAKNTWSVVSTEYFE